MAGAVQGCASAGAQGAKRRGTEPSPDVRGTGAATVRRRRSIGLAGLLLAPPSQALAADARSVWLKNLHTGEEARLHPFGELGVPTPLGWARANHLFRSWRTQLERPINPRLLRVLAELQRRFAGRRIE